MAYFGENACSGWVNFNGQGTVSIRDSYNISSITDHGSVILLTSQPIWQMLIMQLL